jgi:hypothetical protein
MIDNPRTTISGYIGLAGTLLALIGGMRPESAWGQILLSAGIALKGADSVGNLLSRDGKP